MTKIRLKIARLNLNGWTTFSIALLVLATARLITLGWSHAADGEDHASNLFIKEQRLSFEERAHAVVLTFNTINSTLSAVAALSIVRADLTRGTLSRETDDVARHFFSLVRARTGLARLLLIPVRDGAAAAVPLLATGDGGAYQPEDMRQETREFVEAFAAVAALQPEALDSSVGGRSAWLTRTIRPLADHGTPAILLLYPVTTRGSFVGVVAAALPVSSHAAALGSGNDLRWGAQCLGDCRADATGQALIFKESHEIQNQGGVALFLHQARSRADFERSAVAVEAGRVSRLIFFGSIALGLLVLAAAAIIYLQLHLAGVEIHRQGDLISEQNHELMTSHRLSLVGEFAATVAHEVNTPIAAISCLASELQMKSFEGPAVLSGDVDSFAGSIQRYARHTAQIVRSIAAMSRDTASDPPAACGAAAVAADVAMLTRLKLERHGVRLQIDGGGDIKFHGRHADVGQILATLINNAVDAIADAAAKTGRDAAPGSVGESAGESVGESVIMTAAAHTKEDVVTIAIRGDGGRVTLAVTNTGPRIPDAVADRLFQRFFTTKPVGSGTGLGLSTARKIARAGGGEIHLDRAASLTTFVVTLPAASVAGGNATAGGNGTAGGMASPQPAAVA